MEEVGTGLQTVGHDEKEYNAGERRYQTLRLAIALASKGLKVVLMHSVQRGHCSCGGLDCKRPGLHPLVERDDWNTPNFQDIIEGWWEIKNVNVGIRMDTETMRGYLVLNLDGPNLKKAVRIFTGDSHTWYSFASTGYTWRFDHPTYFIPLSKAGRSKNMYRSVASMVAVTYERPI
jgi:hypothetical protein